MISYGSGINLDLRLLHIVQLIVAPVYVHEILFGMNRDLGQDLLSVA